MTTQNDRKAKLEKLCYIIPQFRVWTGQTVLREEDFRLGENGSLPPKGVIAELGMKNTVDPKTLNVFQTIKRRSYRLLEDNGIAWMGGFAVPIDRADDLTALLDGEVKAFEDATVEFLRDYDAHVEKWIRANPEFEEQLRSAVKPGEYVRNRFHAGYVAARLQPLSDNDEAFGKEVDGLSSRLFESVGQLADRFFRESLCNKSVCRSAETLLRIRNKLDGLRFLDSRISPILELVDRVVSHLPSNGAVVKTSFTTNLPSPLRLWACPELKHMVEDVQRVAKPVIGKNTYPVEVVATSLLGKIIHRGVELKIRKEDCAFISNLDGLRAKGKSLFGNGFLLSERAAAERAAAERAAGSVVQLSERERRMVASLSKGTTITI